MDIAQAVVDRPETIARSDVVDLFSKLKSAEPRQSTMPPVMEAHEFPERNLDTANTEGEASAPAQARVEDSAPALRETSRGKLFTQD